MQISKLPYSACLIVVIALFSLQACKSTKQSAQSSPIVIEKPEVIVPPPESVIEAEAGLSLKQRFSNALSYLESGKTPYALAELQEYNRVRPGNPRVVKLIEQIRTPVSELYPDEFYELTLASGQSLSTLSKKYLGSALDFYSLAKYNGIENAKRVLIGQTVKIPKTQLARMIWQRELEAKKDVPEAQPIASVDTVNSDASLSGIPQLDSANDVLSTQDNEFDLEQIESDLLDQGMAKTSEELPDHEAEELVESLDSQTTNSLEAAQGEMLEGVENDQVLELADTSKDRTVKEIGIESLSVEDNKMGNITELEEPRTSELILHEISAHEALGEYDMAHVKLTELEQLDDSLLAQNQALVRSVLLAYAEQSSDSQPIEASLAYIKVIENYVGETDDVQVFYWLSEASQLDPSNADLAQRTQKLKAELAQKYHRQASSAFRRQELDAAISDWDTVLNIDPDHENAKVFRAQAIELKERLDNLQ